MRINLIYANVIMIIVIVFVSKINKENLPFLDDTKEYSWIINANGKTLDCMITENIYADSTKSFIQPFCKERI